MSSAPDLLSPDGRASVATFLMMSHHGLRRDLGRFARALSSGARDPDLLREEWKRFHETLHGHHHGEDSGVFPELRRDHPELAATIDHLSAEHQRIEPLLEDGERAFAQLPDPREARRVIAALTDLLAPHLTHEEAEIIPILRAQQGFPPPASEDEAWMYAQGFAWSAHGVAEDILDEVWATLPESVTSRLPEARAQFAARCEDVWGISRVGAARTAMPDRESL